MKDVRKMSESKSKKKPLARIWLTTADMEMKTQSSTWKMKGKGNMFIGT